MRPPYPSERISSTYPPTFAPRSSTSVMSSERNSCWRSAPMCRSGPHLIMSNPIRRRDDRMAPRTGCVQLALLNATARFSTRKTEEAGVLDQPPCAGVRTDASLDHQSADGARLGAALARLLQRERFTGRDDLVFPGETGGHLDGSALRRRYKAPRRRPSSAAPLPRPAAHLRVARDQLRLDP